MNDESRELLSAFQEMMHYQRDSIISDVQAMMDKQHGETINEVRAIVENGVQRDVQTLAGEMMFMRKRMEHVEKDVADMKNDIQIIKTVVSSHSKELEKLGDVQ